MLEVANKTLTPVDRKQEQEYISEETWQKIVIMKMGTDWLSGIFRYKSSTWLVETSDML